MYEKAIGRLEIEEDIKVLVMSWNMARQKLAIKPETMFVNSSQADIIVCGF